MNPIRLTQPTISRLAAASLCALFGFSLGACATDTTLPDGRVPVKHRAAVTSCPTDRPPGTSMGTGGTNGCTTDNDCKDASKGTNGRCVFSRVGATCSYDTCVDDSTCGGKVCECRTTATMASTATNHCLQEGNCRTDSDCGTGGACSPSFGSCGNYFGVIAYYCHTAKDSCVDDADCAATGANAYCAYNTAAGLWQCSTAQCVG